MDTTPTLLPGQILSSSGRPRLDYAAVATLALPFMANSAIQAVLNATDTWFMGRISPTALSAMGAVYWPVLVFVFLFGGVGLSVQTLVAQADGAKDYPKASQATWLALWGSLFTLPVFVLLALVGAWMFAPFGIAAATRDMALAYWGPRMLGAPLGVALWSVLGFFNGIGKAGITLRITLGVAVANALLNQWFIFGLGGGIAGSAWATGAAQLLGLVVALCFFLSPAYRTRYSTTSTTPLRLVPLWRQTRLGLPMGLLFAADIFGFAMFQLMQVRLGTIDGAATQIVMVLTSFCYMPAFGIAMAGTTLVGQAIGAGNRDWAAKVGNGIIVLAVAFMGLVGVGLAACGAWIMPWFAGSGAESAAIAAEGCVLLWIAAAYQLFDGLSISSGSCLRGAGDALVPAAMVLALSWGLFVPLAHSLSFAPGAGWVHGLPQFGLGAVGGWLAAVAYIFCLGTLLFARWRSGTWRRIVLSVLATGIFLGLALPQSARAAETAPAAIRAAIAEEGLPAGAVSFIVIDTATGKTVAAANADVPRSPASTMKVVTTYAALDSLGPAYLWHTRAFARGEVRDGILSGDLVLKGGGDPYLTLERWWGFARQLRNTGLRAIHGDIIIDDSAYALPPEDPGAFDGRPNRSYNVAPDALLVNFQSVEFHVAPDTAAQRVIVSADPLPDNLVIDNRIRFAAGRCRRSADRVDFTVKSSLQDHVVFSGTLAAQCPAREFRRALLQPREYAYGTFLAYWRQLGGEFSGHLRTGTAPADAVPLLDYDSQSLGELIRLTNKFSNNVMARDLFLTLGTQRFGEPATLENSRTAIAAWGQSRNLGLEQMRIDNGSGLSREERISAAALARVLLLAWHSPFQPEFLASLPLAGIDGTLRSRLRDVAAGSVRLKTGSLAGVSAIAGFVTAADGSSYVTVSIVNDARADAGAAESVHAAVIRWTQGLARTVGSQAPIAAQ
jgi:multidrug resistance protein, MATE family